MSDLATKYERVMPEEIQFINTLRGLLNNAQKANPEAARRRGQHPKAHGCVWAKFRIDARMPDSLQTDLFKPEVEFDALVRFSNGRVFDDTQRDAHGMAIKLLGVHGPRAMDEGERATQDFILADSPNFFAKDVQHMLDFVIQTAPVAAGGGGKTAAELVATTHPHVATFTKHAASSPMDMTYWSQTPYLLGSTAVKYVARPGHEVDVTPVTQGSGNFLREAMAARLRQLLPVQYQLYAQPISDNESVEDATEIWSGSEIAVATITIDPQEIDTEHRHQFCEHLSFSPWQAHQEHQPLGAINRARKGIYLDSRTLRESVGQVPFREPTVEDKC